MAPLSIAAKTKERAEALLQITNDIKDPVGR